jgi:uncharacterized protein
MAASDVVADAGPLIALAQIGRLDLLRSLFGTVFMPPAVAQEIVSVRPIPSWIERRDLAARPALPALASLDLGEREALLLALQLGGATVLLDERPGRRAAGQLRVPVIGTLGVLALGTMHGHIGRLRPEVDRLLDTGFFASAGVIEAVLRAVQE